MAYGRIIPNGRLFDGWRKTPGRPCGVGEKYFGKVSFRTRAGRSVLDVAASKHRSRPPLLFDERSETDYFADGPAADYYRRPRRAFVKRVERRSTIAVVTYRRNGVYVHWRTGKIRRHGRRNFLHGLLSSGRSAFFDKRTFDFSGHASTKFGLSDTFPF